MMTNIEINKVKVQDIEIENAYLIIILMELRRILGSCNIKKFERRCIVLVLVYEFQNWCASNSKLFHRMHIVCDDANNIASMIENNWYGIGLSFQLYQCVQVINYNLKIRYNNETGQLEVEDLQG